jgi:hypothetical protein
MNRFEAYAIISAVLERYRSLGYSALCSKIGRRGNEEVIAPSGVRYTVDISVRWTDSARRSVTIHGRIDDQNTFHSVPLEERLVIKRD